jgi:hypothetical protein
MIRYALVCLEAHAFDGWFRSSSDFEQQSERRLVTCAICGSSTVERALMAPNVVTGRSRAARPDQAPDASSPSAPIEAPVPVAMTPDPQQRAMFEALAALKRKLIASADDVGDQFAEEARKIHYGESEERGIYGRTTIEEARALLDEGIEVQALPLLPDDRN